MYSSKVAKFARNLIDSIKTIDRIEGHTVDLNKLATSDWLEFAALLIEEDRTEFCVIYEQDNIIKSTIELFKNDTQQNRLELIDQIKDNTINYYKESIKKVINEQLPEVAEQDYWDEEQNRRLQHHSDHFDRNWEAQI